MADALRDVVIVGAGPVGAALALALADADLDVLLLDARPEGSAPAGERSLALSHGSRLVLERLGVFAELDAVEAAVTPILEIDVSEAGSAGHVRLSAAEQRLPALGYVVSYTELQGAMDAALAHRGVAVHRGAEVTDAGGTPAYVAVMVEGRTDPVLGRLAIVADGRGTRVSGIARHRHDYRQSAVIASVATGAPHGGLAFERFTRDGPVALLPEGEHYGLVWTVASADTDALLALSDEAFLDRLAQHFGRRVEFLSIGARRSFPLALAMAPSPIATRCAVIGNAAQLLHPIAGQGFNLGLRDAYEMSRIVVDTPRAELGSRAMLERYARERRIDRYAGVAFTHGLLGLFGSSARWLRGPRAVGLSVLDAVSPLKRAFTRAMLFGLH